MAPSESEQGQPAPIVSEFDGEVGTILQRVQASYPNYIDLSLERLETLLARLGNPERALPPIIHVAGTNGKGSTCAFLRAIAEANGTRTHVMTSPHLVSVTERFRLNGALIPEAKLADALREAETVNAGAPITVFEILTAAGFMLFGQTPADLAFIEVGLGGRLDATNVIARPSVSVLTPIGLDHQSFLGDNLAQIAHEKAGIIKANCPVVSARQHDAVGAVIEDVAARSGAPLWRLGQEFDIYRRPSGEITYQDPLGTLRLPKPALQGAHQLDNAALAVAALRAQTDVTLFEKAWRGIERANWPARLQKLTGNLTGLLPKDWDLWLDGGHNPHAAHALCKMFETWADRPLHLLIGVKRSKDVAGFIRPLLPFASSVQAITEERQYDAIPIAEIISASNGIATPGPDIRTALSNLSGPSGRVLICGSLYLAGIALRLDGVTPH